MKLKKLLPLFLLSTMLVACGGGDAKDDEKKDDEKQDPTPTPTPDPDPDPKPDPDPEPPVTEVTYYLAGSFNEWTAKDENYTLTADPANAKHFFYEGLELHEGDELKVTDSKGNWHPDGMGNNTVAEADGVYTVNLNLDQDPLISLEKTGDLEPDPQPQPQPNPGWATAAAELAKFFEEEIPAYTGAGTLDEVELASVESYYMVNLHAAPIFFDNATEEDALGYFAALEEAGWDMYEGIAISPEETIKFTYSVQASYIALVFYDTSAITYPDYVAKVANQGLNMSKFAFTYDSTYNVYFYDYHVEAEEQAVTYELSLIKGALVQNLGVEIEKDITLEDGGYYMFTVHGDVYTVNGYGVPSSGLVEIEIDTYVPVSGNGWDLAAAELEKFFTEEDIPAYTGAGTVDTDYVEKIIDYLESEYYGFAPVYFDDATEQDALDYFEALDDAGWEVFDNIAVSPEETIMIKYSVNSGYITFLFYDLSRITYPDYVKTVANQGLDMIEYAFSNYYDYYYYYDMHVEADDSSVQYTLSLIKGMLVQNLGVEIDTDITLTEKGYYMLEVHGSTYAVTVYGVPSNGLIEIQIAEYLPEPETDFVATVEEAFGLEEGTLAWDSHYMEFWAHWETTYTDKAALAEYVVGVLEGLGLIEDPEESVPEYDWYYYAGEEGYVSVYVYDNDTEGLWIEVSVGLNEEEPVEPSDKPEAVLALEEALFVEFELQQDDTYAVTDSEWEIPAAYIETMIANYVVAPLQELGYDYIEGFEGIQYDSDDDIYYIYMENAAGDWFIASIAGNEGTYGPMQYTYVPAELLAD